MYSIGTAVYDDWSIKCIHRTQVIAHALTCGNIKLLYESAIFLFAQNQIKH